MDSLPDWPKIKGRHHMQVSSWNVRGLGDFLSANSKLRQINDILACNRAWDVFFMQEHKLDKAKIADVKRMFCPQGDTIW